jgi:hypothetical protein
MRAMGDDFRIAVDFEEEGHVLHFARTLRERELVNGLRERLGENVVVTRDGNHVFVYAGTLEQAEAASRVVRDVLPEHGTPAEVSPVLQWHPVEERWEDASIRLPEGKAEIDVEHERWEKQQAREAQESGYAEWRFAWTSRATRQPSTSPGNWRRRASVRSSGAGSTC